MSKVFLENLGKSFICTDHVIRHSGLFHNLVNRKVNSQFWALRYIDLKLDQGQVLGVIGRNGSGKTTLLNIIAGIIPHSEGKLEINGKVSSLISLGAGFQDELTGRENIYLNASIYGMSKKEIDKKIDQIIEFSELEGFLDSPLYTYSQGMRIRLGFSIAIYVDFNILLLDEIIAVGDIAFQKKCFASIDNFKNQGKAMIITTQNMDIINRLCDRAILLESGNILEKGNPAKVIARYLEVLNEKKLSQTFSRYNNPLKWWADKQSWGKFEGSKEAKITSIEICNSKGKLTNRLYPCEKVRIKINFDVAKDIESPHFGVAIFREDGLYCYGPNTRFDGHEIDRIHKGKGFFLIEYRSLSLMPGKYRISVAIWDKDEVWAYDYHVASYRFEILGKNEYNQLADFAYSLSLLSWKEKFFKKPTVDLSLLFNREISNNKDDSCNGIKFCDLTLSDSSGNVKDEFCTNSNLSLELKFDFGKLKPRFNLWAGIFREDDVYFHGVFSPLTKNKVVILYPKLSLLSGRYYISVAVYDSKGSKVLFFMKKAVCFSVKFPREDHGAIYLDHSWSWLLPVSQNNEE